ncbi:hypothetical protein GOODEAATRI_006781, partial [Goodea atripinnis]
RTQDPVLAQTGMSADSHREPVYQVAWVPLQKKGEFGVLSSSSGGGVLLWLVDSDQGRMVLNAAYAFVRQQVPHSSSLKPQWPLKAGACLQEPRRCSRSGLPAVRFTRNLFVSAGTDGMVHVHSMLQADPLLSVRVSDWYVFQVQWSPSRPLVFAAATGQGEVQIFDLARKSLRPAATIQDGAPDQTATCLAFNGPNPRLLAVGKSDGTVGIWQLSSVLTEQSPTESFQLEQIANQVAE